MLQVLWQAQVGQRRRALLQLRVARQNVEVFAREKDNFVVGALVDGVYFVHICG